VSARTAILSVAALFAFAGLASAQINSDQPLEIEADTLDVHNEQGLAVYEGQVDAVRGEAQLRTDRMEVYFASAQDGAGIGDRDVIRAIAIGNVYYVTPTQVATGERAVYDVAADTITLTGPEVVVTQGCDVLTGTEVVFNLTTNDAQVRAGGQATEGRPGRVRTVINTGDSAETTTAGCAP